MTNGLVQHMTVEESISIQRDNYKHKIGTVYAVSFDICLLSEMTFQEFKDVSYVQQSQQNIRSNKTVL